MDDKKDGGIVYTEGLVYLHNDSVMSKKQAEKFKKLFSEIGLDNLNNLNLDDIKISLPTEEDKTKTLEGILELLKEIITEPKNTIYGHDFEEFLHDEEIVFMPKPDMIDRIYLCEEGLINCFRCIGKENCNHYRTKDRSLEE